MNTKKSDTNKNRNSNNGINLGKCEVVDQVYSTANYDAFKILNGNRSVLEPRKRMIMKSIKERGWIRNPIIINENMEIIDGQGRFEALKEMSIPVEFVLHERATIDDCIALNIKQKNWGNLDYIHCYAETGNKEYILLEKLIEEYKGKLDFTIVIQIAGATTKDASNNLIKYGKFRIMDHDTVKKRLDYVFEMFNIIGAERGRMRVWGAIFKFVYYCDAINKHVLAKKLNDRIETVVPAVTVSGGITQLESVYNFGRNNKVYFMPEFEKYKKSFAALC